MATSVGFLLLFSLPGIRTLAEMACRIAVEQNVQVTYLYRCASCPASFDPGHSAVELELYRCVASRLPVVTRNIEAHELEPLRRTDSLSIFHIPAGEKGDSLVRRILDMLNPRQPRKHLHKYLFMWPDARQDQLLNLFRGSWAKQLLYGLAITHADGGFSDFDPFAVGGLQVIGRSGGDLYFPHKMKDLRGYPLRFSMFTDPLMAVPRNPVESAGYQAVDGVAARVAARMLNASVTYVLPADDESYGRCLPDGNFTGVVRDLVGGLTHFGPNSRFVLDCIWPEVEVLYPHTRRVLYLVVPASEIQPEYLIFVRVFRRSVWHLLLVTLLTVVLIFWLMQRLQEGIPRRQVTHIQATWYEILEVFGKTHVGEPAGRFSSFSSMRTILMGWILFSYVLTTIYFAKLESAFVRPSYAAQVDRVAELAHLDVHVYAVSTMYEAVKPVLTAHQYRLLESRIRQLPLGLTTSYYQLVVSRRDQRSAFIMRDFHARDFLALTYNSQAERPSYHIVKEYLRSMICTYILPRGSPFLQRLESLFSGFHEHGFFEHWRQMDLITRDLTSPNAEEFFEDLGDQTDTDPVTNEAAVRRNKRVVLTLDILQGAFYLWSVGIGMSCLGFTLEHAHHLWRLRSLRI
ncbi:LOW QUALITY PROTEIN: uncharacterized protein LOC128260169 [Drosophila gunungcola]|uniref:LOW QUALITY PROTEIN: uncharacterized protein LOC128260169 n=1 Tax=Drosophila gunungcola TaxID=103775 RepID=UPI0022E2B1E8|nr:LOW QUALITY PROTEIN: uncharacterized protein LOC128260169 [Drosophila gunungcola]